MVQRLDAEPRLASLLTEAPAPTVRRATPRNCAWFNPQVACWARYRVAIMRQLGLADPTPTRAALARAVERWQAAQGLSVDGVMGPRTWQRLWSLLGVAPVPAVTTQLPPDGPGFYAYARRRPHHRYGRPETVRALQAVGAGWAMAHPGGPRIGIGDISLRGGGPIWGHCSHQCGIDVDVYPVRSDGQERGVRWNTPGYSRALTQELVDRIHRNGVLPTRFILFNDRAITGVKPHRNHDDHLHVRFSLPSGASPEAPDREVAALTEALGLAEAAVRAEVETRAEEWDLGGVLGGRVRLEAESGQPHHRPFPAAVIERVRRAYEENHDAAIGNSNDRAACIVMLNVALGHLLGLRMKRWVARGGSSRRVMMGDLTTDTIERAMARLEQQGRADPPIRIRFLDRRGKTAGTLAPVRMDGSVAQTVLRNTGTAAGWYAFALSIMDGYHSVLLLVHRSGTGARIYWLDQFSTGINDDVTETLDDRVTMKTTTWWQAVYDTKKKGYNTVARVWRLRSPTT